MSVSYSTRRNTLEATAPYTPPLILPSAPLDTVAIVHAAHPDGFVVINAADFDPAQHTKYAPGGEPDAAPSASKKRAKTAPASA